MRMLSTAAFPQCSGGCRRNCVRDRFPDLERHLTVGPLLLLVSEPRALAQFFKVLRPGGVLLVDKSSFESAGIYVIQKEGVVDSKACHIHWVFVNDIQSGLRRWDQYNTVEKETTCLTVYSLLITEKMLVDWLTTAGFISVCPTSIQGENIYTVLTARKPVGILPD